jgi:hypothetical protein
MGIIKTAIHNSLERRSDPGAAISGDPDGNGRFGVEFLTVRSRLPNSQWFISKTAIREHVALLG